MSAPISGMFHAVGKVTNAVCTDPFAFLEMQGGRRRRIFDLERKSKRDVCLPERPYQVASDHESPLTNRVHGRCNKEWVTGNGSQLGDGIVFTNNQEESHFPLNAREPSLSGVNGAHSI